MTQHPRPNDHGQAVFIQNPSQATPLAHWLDPNAVACVLPDGLMPEQLNGLAFERWDTAPTTPSAWQALAQQSPIQEPALVVPPAFHRVAAGAVVIEPDGRIWLVAPSNQFGGYKATFPKGSLDGKSPQATALTEVFEESGLHVQLLRHLIDVPRSASFTRYYLAKRLGGHPADMGWESQAVLLVPAQDLKHHLNNPHDAAILAAIQNL